MDSEDKAMLLLDNLGKADQIENGERSSKSLLTVRMASLHKRLLTGWPITLLPSARQLRHYTKETNK